MEHGHVEMSTQIINAVALVHQLQLLQLPSTPTLCGFRGGYCTRAELEGSTAVTVEVHSTVPRGGVYGVWQLPLQLTTYSIRCRMEVGIQSQEDHLGACHCSAYGASDLRDF